MGRVPVCFRSPVAAAMGGAGGLLTGYLLGEEVPKLFFGTNTVDPIATHAAFQQWWVKRVEQKQQLEEAEEGVQQ